MRSLIDALPYALKYAMMITKTINGKKILDFEMLKKPQIIIKNLDIDLEIKYENEVFGFNISLFKTSPYETNDKIIDVSIKKRALVVARILKNKTIKDKNGNIMGIFKLQDSTMEIDAFAFHHIYEFIKSTKKDKIVKTWLEYKNARYIINRK